MHFTGTEDDDVIDGTTGNDDFDMSQGGNDTVSGGNGKDTFNFGATLTADDIVNGGTGIDTLVLKGDYSAGVVFKSTTISQIEKLQLEKGFDYNLTLAETEHALTIQAAPGSHHTLTIDASAMSSDLHIKTNAGHNNLIGGSGNDIFEFGDRFNAANEHIDGGDTFRGLENLVVLEGEYHKPIVLGSAAGANIVNVSYLFQGAFEYNVVVGSGFAAAGKTRTFHYSEIGDGHIAFDASASAANIVFSNLGTQNQSVHADLVMGSGDDIVNLDGNGGVNTIDLSHGGNDKVIVTGPGIEANVSMGASFTAQDVLQAQRGSNLINLALDGDYSAGVVLGANFRGVFEVNLAAGHSYSFTAVNADDDMWINGLRLGEADHLFFDGSAETTGSTFQLNGGDGDDVLIGGGGSNNIFGGHGEDTITGGAGDDRITAQGGSDVIDITDTTGVDTLVYDFASDSSLHYDTLIGFNARRDFFLMDGQVTGIDSQVKHGTLDGDQGTSVFGSELSAILDAGHLAAHHAVVFTPDSGSLAGSIFLVVDQNGVAGFQGGEDIVIKLMDPVAIDQLKAANFDSF